jgi:hypothetical protein
MAGINQIILKPAASQTKKLSLTAATDAAEINPVHSVRVVQRPILTRGKEN